MGTERELRVRALRPRFECWLELDLGSVGSRMSRLFHMTERADLVAAEDDACRPRFENLSLLRFHFGHKLGQTRLYLGNTLFSVM